MNQIAYWDSIGTIIILKINLTSLKMSPKFAKFVLVQATQSNVLPLNGCPHESTLLYTAGYTQLSISRFALLTSTSMVCFKSIVVLSKKIRT